MSSIEIKSTKKRSSVNPATMVVQRTPHSSVRMSMGGGPGSNVIQRRVVSSSYSSMPSLKPGVVTEATRAGLSTVKTQRDKEQKEMQSLNDKFANWIEKVKFLEGTVTQLTAECDKLRNALGYDQKRVAELCREEMQELRDGMKTLENNNADLLAKLGNKDDEIETLEEKVKSLEDIIKRLNKDLANLGNENADLVSETQRYKNENDRLNKELDDLKHQLDLVRADNKRIRDDMEAAVAAQLNECQRATDLQEKCDFMEQCNDEEVAELKAIIDKLKQPATDISGMWKRTLADCVRKIEDDYKGQIDKMSEDMRRNYDEQIMRIQHGIQRENTDGAVIKEECKTLKSQLNDRKGKLNDLDAENARLRKRLEQLTDEMDEKERECCDEKRRLQMEIDDLQADAQDSCLELQELQAAKLGLEAEIATYRRLLDGAEGEGFGGQVSKRYDIQSRGGDELSKLVLGGGGGSSMQSTMSESKGTINVKKTSKCAVTICEVATNGDFCMLENTSGAKDFDLGGWTMERKHPKGQVSYKFPAGYSLKRGKRVKIYGSNTAPADKRDLKDDLVAGPDCPEFGIGDGTYTLYDTLKNDKAVSTIKFN